MTKSLKILLIANAFKNHFASSSIRQIFYRVASSFSHTVSLTGVLMADGGDGSLDAIKDCIGGKIVDLEAMSSLGQKTDTHYLCKDDTVYIELANICGMNKVNTVNSYTALYSHTYGLGQVIKHSLKYKPKNIVINLGGSISTDGGSGALCALGIDFYDRHNQKVNLGGKYLGQIKYLVNNIIVSDINFVVACDVDNPLLGDNGTAGVFARQKGASCDDVKLLENGLNNYARVLNDEFATNLVNAVGAGAAGGCGYGLMTALKAHYISGFEYISNLIDLPRQIQESDLVITGEGILDDTSLRGKTTGQIAKICQKLGKELYVFCAFNKLTQNYRNYAISYVLELCSKQKTKASLNDLELAAYELMRRFNDEQMESR